MQRKRARGWRQLVRPLMITSVVIFGVSATAYAYLEVWYYWFHMPPIIRGLTPGVFRELPKGLDTDARFTARVHAAFPAGMEESALLEDLRGQGFSGPFQGPQGKKYVEFTAMFIVCRKDWFISWRSTGATVSEINASTTVACL